jgi:NADH-quinone oxidoreductase subunit I
MAWLGVCGGLWTTVKNALRRPWTVEYPKQVRKRAERYRASFALVHDEHGEEACVACLLCEKICPSQVITIKAGPKRESPVTGKKRQYLEDFTLDLTACIYCELCVQVCPTDAIVMVSRSEQPSFSREGLLLSREALYANESQPLAWANGSKLMAMQEPPKPPAAPKAAVPAAAAASTATTPAPAPPVGPDKVPASAPADPPASPGPAAPVRGGAA